MRGREEQREDGEEETFHRRREVGRRVPNGCADVKWVKSVVVAQLEKNAVMLSGAKHL